jgi:hypothetical protein
VIRKCAERNALISTKCSDVGLYASRGKLVQSKAGIVGTRTPVAVLLCSFSIAIKIATRNN